MDCPGSQDSVQASNLFADDLFQDPPVLNGYGHHIGSSGDSSPMSDFQPWSSFSDFGQYHQGPSWSAFSVGSDLCGLSGLTGSSENLHRRPRSSSALSSYSDYLAAFDESELSGQANCISHASADGLDTMHCDPLVHSGRNLYQEAMNQWTSMAPQGNYDPFGNHLESTKLPTKPSYSEVAKNRPAPQRSTNNKKPEKNLPRPPVDVTALTRKKGRVPRAFNNPRARPKSFTQGAPVVKPNSKYGLDEFDVPGQEKEKLRRSVSADPLNHSRRGSCSSVASSNASHTDDPAHKISNLNKCEGSEPSTKMTGADQVAAATKPKSSPRDDSRANSVKQNNETQTEKVFFDPRRIFQSSPRKVSNTAAKPKNRDRPATILNNDTTRLQPSSSNSSSVHKATYINNNLHEGMESRKRTNTEVKQDNVPSFEATSGSSSSASTVNISFLLSGLSVAYQWITWFLKKSTACILVVLVLALKVLWLAFLTGLYYLMVLVQKIWFFIKKKVLRMKGLPDGGQYDWSKFPRQPRQEGLEENITLPTTGAEAMKRLLSYKGKDPYSILGLRHDASDDDIKRYYKKQAFLVHPDKNPEPGAEEAFKILGRAFELIGDPVKRQGYDTQQFQDNAMDENLREFTDLLQRFHEKMEEAANQMRCDTCGGKHRRLRTDLPWYSARRCDRCQTRHSAKEGDIWAETSMLGFRWNYFACMDNEVYDITELAACQVDNFRHVMANSHSVSLRMQTNSGRHHHSSSRSSEAELQDFINNLFHKTMDPSASHTSQKSAPPHNQSSHSTSKKKRKNKKRH